MAVVVLIVSMQDTLADEISSRDKLALAYCTSVKAVNASGEISTQFNSTDSSSSESATHRCCICV